MKSKKLNLNKLKVKSFVTDLENGKANTAKGGTGTFWICTVGGGPCEQGNTYEQCEATYQCTNGIC